MSLLTRTVYAVECDWCGRQLPDGLDGIIGWDSLDGLTAELNADYERWYVAPNGRHCCGDCALMLEDGNGFIAPDGSPLYRFDDATGITIN